MIEHILTIILGFILLLTYLLIFHKDKAAKLYFYAMRLNTKKYRYEYYMENFKMHRESRMSGNFIIQILPWLFVLGLAYILSHQYFIFGSILTGSMEPELMRGDLVLMQTFALKVNVGDIIMLPMFGFYEPVTHRVIGFTKEGNIVTKGDANPVIDGAFPPDVVAGKAIMINGKPILLRGLGTAIRPEQFGEMRLITESTSNLVFAQAFEQFRALQPIFIFFGTIFYFFLLIESRTSDKRRSGNSRKEQKKTNRSKSD